jgi:hypothetical protein
MAQTAPPPVRLSPGAGGAAAATMPGVSGAGEPLSPAIQSAIETSLQVDLRSVRVRTDPQAQSIAKRLGTRAVTYGTQILLGPGERVTDLPLMAHEVAHVAQQQGMPRLQGFAPDPHDVYEHEAHQTSAAVVRGEPFTVRERTSGPRVQGFDLGLPNPLDYFANKANLIPGFRMFTIILGVNPINMSRVDRSAANILRALIEFLPGGGLITQALDNHGVFDKVGAWVEQQIQTLGLVGSAIKQAMIDFIASLSLDDILDLGGVWERAKRIFTDPIDRIINFAKGLVTGIIQFIKDAILMPLAKLAEGTRGWDLLIAVLGRNPITGEAVPRTAETLIGGFMKLIGQEDVWENMKRANAIGRAWAWFQGAITALMGFVAQIPTLAMNAFKALELVDIILVPRAFAKVAAVFGNFIGNFISWAGTAVWNLLEIIFDVVSPGALRYIKRAGAALKSILKNPLPFIGNLVKAAKLGFQNFATNFGTHLKAGLIDWLTGSLPGIYIPKAFSLSEIIKFVFSVLGLSWANVRQKLVKVVGETAVKAMETGFDIVITLVTQGPAAAWDKIKDQLANLKDMVIGGITDFVIDMVVKKAIPKLIAMFIPGAGFISAILSIYDTIMVFVNKISKIIQVVTGFIDSLVAIAGGTIAAAATRVETTLAGLLSLAISFLAGFIGLGRVSDKVMGVINKVRAPIDKALDWLINWIVTMAKKLFAMAFGKKDGETDQSKAVKQKVRRDLSGKQIKDAEQANALISAIYAKYSSEGLKGIRFLSTSARPGFASIRVNASLPEVVADLPLTSVKEAEALKEFATTFDFLAGGTKLYVYYDLDNKPYSGSPIENDPGGAHAEAKFASNHMARLRAEINEHRKKGTLKTAEGTPLKVELNLNRLTCPRCSAIVAGLASGNSDMAFVVKASSVSNEATLRVHATWIAELIDKGVIVEPLGIWPEIKMKFLELQAKLGTGEIAFKGQSNNFLSFVHVARRIEENLGKEQGVKDLIDEAKRLLEKEKVMKKSKDNLAKVSPKGSGA